MVRSLALSLKQPSSSATRAFAEERGKLNIFDLSFDLSFVLKFALIGHILVLG